MWAKKGTLSTGLRQGSQNGEDTNGFYGIVLRRDDFCQKFDPFWHQRQLALNRRHRQRRQQLSLIERMTIIIAFRVSRYRDFN
jgi:hypothetical protein